MNHRLCVLIVVGVLVTAAVGPVTAATGSDLASVGPTADTGVQTCTFPVTMTDATGTDVTVRGEPSRVVVLWASAAQTMWDIGAKGKVVGAPVNRYASYLDGIEERTDVSGDSPGTIDVEQVVNLTPDLVLAPNIIPNETVRKLRDAGLTVYKFRAATSIQAVYAKTNRTGRLVGACDGAAARVAWMQDRLATVRKAVQNEPTPTVLFSMGGGFTAGTGTFIDEMITTAGGENVAAAANVTGYAKLSDEVVVQQDPHWIIQNGPVGTVPATPAYNGTYAVQHDQVFTVNPNYVSQPGPRIVYPIVSIAKHLHPKAYTAANASTTTTRTAESSATTSTTTTTESGGTTESTSTATGGTTTGGQPGFGPSIAVLSLVGGALLAERRR